MQSTFRGIFVTALVGCGHVTSTPPDASPDADPFGAGQHSGTRLKLEYFEFDSTRFVLGIRDSARREYCFFQQWSSGNWYCTPQAGGQIVFSDSGCGTKIGLGFSDPCVTSLYFREAASGCDSTLTMAHLYSSGAKLTLNQYYTLDNGTCTAHSGAGIAFYALDAEVSVADLEPGVVGAPEGPGRIQKRAVTSADGLRKLISPQFDSELNINCTVHADGRCVPTSAANATYFLDGNCMTQAATVDNACPNTLISGPGGCSFRALGPKVESSFLYFQTTFCGKTPIQPGQTAFEFGPPVTLATLSRVPVDNGQRIRPIRYAELGIPDAYNLYDADKQAECFPGILADGTVFCFPTGASISSRYFTDKNCAATSAVDIVAIPTNNDSCSPPTVPAFAVKSTNDSQSCARNAESHPVGALHDGPLYEFAPTCMPASTLFTYYDVGPALLLGELARGALVVDSP